MSQKRRRPSWPTQRHYPRMARVNELLREVLAEEIELVAAADSRLELLTVTAVACEPDLRHAKVLLASLPDAALAGLGEARPRLQKAVAQQAKLKRTPQLSFAEDPAILAGTKVEEILRAIQLEDEARGPALDGEMASDNEPASDADATPAGEREPPQ